MCQPTRLFLFALMASFWTWTASAAVITVTTADNASGPGDGQTSFDEALRAAAGGDTIRFNISGAGPHVIVTPMGGYPLITANNLTIDGYSQPGATPNNNPILGGNNAQIKIVLDSTGADSAPNPLNGTRPLRRSSRLDFPEQVGNTGYGETENAILGVYGADNFSVRGLSFLGRRTAGTANDPGIYGVALVNQATNARVQGCWFGLAPGGSLQSDLRPVAAAVAGFRWRIGGDVYSERAIIGTDGDGVNDRAEFNVMVGGRISLALELPGARISGNYVNVFPDGLHFVDIDANYQLWGEALASGGEDPADVSIENYENGRVTEGTIIGTNGDGVSDSDERNIFGHVVYDHHGEFYSSSRNAVVAGNYFGVGVDGVTPAPLSTNISPDFIEFGGAGEVRIGSNGDGVSDELEGNLIVNVPGGRFVKAGGATPIVSRRNRLVNCNFSATPFADGENAVYTTYYAPFLDVSGGTAPVLQRLNNGILDGRMPSPTPAFPNAVMDLYLVDPAALGKTNFWPSPMTHPQTYLGSYRDNGPEDLNSNQGEFSINISGFGLSDSAYVSMAASYSAESGRFNATNSVTSPMSNPISKRPVLAIKADAFTGVELSWIAAEGAYQPQANDLLSDPNTWVPLPLNDVVHYRGRNIISTTFDPFSTGVFFRVISQ